MDNKKTLLNFAFDLICTAAVSVTVPLLLYYAFDLKAEPGTVFVCTLLFAVLFSAAFSSGRTLRALSVILFGVLLLLWNGSAALDSSVLFAKSVADGLLNSFDSFSHLESKLVVGAGASCNFALSAVGVAIAALTAVGVFSKKRTESGMELFPAAVLAWGAFILSAVQSVSAVPACPVAAFCGAWALLFLTRGCHLADRGFWQWLMIPAAVFMAVCLIFASPSHRKSELTKSYSSQWQSIIYDFSPIKAVEDGVRIVRPRASQSLGNAVWNKYLNQADLARVVPNPYSDSQVMSVKSDSPGLFYLRGNSLGVYSGVAWKAVPFDRYSGISLDETLFVKDGDRGYAHFTVRTEHDCQQAYAPTTLTSLPERMVPYLDAYLANPDRLTAYSMDIHPMFSSRMLTRYPLPDGYGEFVYENYLQIPDTTADFLAEYYQPPEDADLGEILGSVSAKLTSEKSYDRQTMRMTRGSGDFVVWFLSQSETGYCIHFASAGAMMLRACGIPARLVTGYVTYIDSDQWTIVRQGDAHAWVEYYVDGEGWYVFDPTPAGSGAEGVVQVAAAARTELPGSETEKRPAASYQAGSHPAKEKESGINVRGIIFICLVIAWLIWFFGLKIYRSVQFQSPDLNKRVLAIYHWIVLISKLDGVLPPEDAKAIALKARFSKEGADEKDVEEILRIYNVTCERMHIYSEFWRAFVANCLLAI